MSTLILPNRDARIDFFRGVALWSMFIDHLLLSWLRAITLHEYAFCDSAELFVLLSGISAGMVYQKALARDGLWRAWSKILRRVAVIYRTHLLMFLLFVAEAGALVAWLRPPAFLQVLNLEVFAAHPFESVLNAVLLRYQPKFFDILPVYVALLLLLCLALPLFRWPRLVLGSSLLLYVAARALPLNLPAWAGVWYFNPFAWQAVFLIGAVARSILVRKTYSRGWDALALLFALFSLFESHSRHLANHVPAALLLHFEVDKPNLHPLRLVAILALVWLGWRFVPASASWLRSRFAEPFVLLGQHSLPVFSSSILIAILGEAVLFKNAGWLSQLLVAGVGSMALLAVGAVSAWSGQAPRSADRARLTESEPEQQKAAAPVVRPPLARIT